MKPSDLQVTQTSQALEGMVLDVVVSGSVGAVESVRFVRSLRRLGAQVVPWLTSGGAQLVAPMALAWAADNEVRQEFSGTKSHLAENDACVVAPMSASFLARLAGGHTDTPATALCSSYLGHGKPVIVCPNMHESLAAAPMARENLKKIVEWEPPVKVVEPRREEGKYKFPEPAVLADEVAHEINNARTGLEDVLVLLGSTRGYIDEVRYITNYSSGRLGSLIAEELYRFGHKTRVVCGSCRFRPATATHFTEALTNEEMTQAATEAVAGGAAAAVFTASVLDYVPDKRIEGKIKSDRQSLTVQCRPTSKIIAAVNPTSGIKVGFKLETGIDNDGAAKIAADYILRYGLSMMVVNNLDDVGEDRHKALVFEKTVGDHLSSGESVVSKEAIASRVAAHIRKALLPAGY